MKRYKVVLRGVILFVIGLTALWQSLLIPHLIKDELWVGTLPTVLAVILCAIGGYWIIKDFHHSKKRASFDLRYNISPILLIGVSLSFYLVISKLGFFIALLLLSPIVLFIFGIRKPFTIFSFTLIATSLSYLLLYKVFGLTLTVPLVGYE
ncbi:tripartite tricarboxylate transporter TctB family protein [Parashewanella tropica]|uniref:tripartite tricarboxylate transporter TctB family protein n=1 Tax=Parashewanella tropica TaxID=2547970 RepID=UPI00105980F4|nr:tripartite tricarboxylate transporter TctB family protein [Parashewanella tropica]